MSENKKTVSADEAAEPAVDGAKIDVQPRPGLGTGSSSTGTAASAADDDEPAFAWMVPSGGKTATTGAPGQAAPASRSAEPSAPGSAALAAPSSVFHEPLPTSMLQVRPPQEDVDRRAAQREEAAKVQPLLPRVMQVLLAICYPFVLLVLAIRLITTPLFLWAEYYRPGFPADSFGFSTDDRMTYGSYVVDYLLNFSGPRFLGDLVKPGGRALFNAGEVSHMADVKSVISMAFVVGAVLAVVMVIGIIYLMRRSTGGVRRGLFAGSIVTLVLVIGLAVLAFMGWETFFADFHKIFFKNGTWTFYLDDSLIRLFPEQFWTDSSLLIGVVVFFVSTLTLAFTWPTKQRRNVSARAKSRRQGRRAVAGA
ncbi:TIGR01906 family membrane protein [Arthrobacter sp. H14-L1]|uniref:TIGR01906 family membrane protein n=1 Tax=Arthrobacter sp. H14-L1 TaxID=2996697 RepID=UPI0022701904|nr:TIGR01906 family membrane protein [Arthrobacter sp. H14-L1]MCY0904948.1 TIGR01906 family membrane protein [Arthrobacter sp. H14-L1]